MGWQMVSRGSGLALAASCLVAIGAACSSSELRGSEGGLAGSGGVSAPSSGGGGLGGTSGMGVVAGMSAGGTATVIPITQTTPMPCAVATIVKTVCQTCHGDSLLGGAPVKLLSQTDFANPAYKVATTAGKKGTTVAMAVLALDRVTSGQMPQGTRKLTDSEKKTLSDWLTAGAPAGTAADQTCAEPPIGTGGMGGGTGGTLEEMPPGPDFGSPKAGTGETCYDFRNHGGQTVGDMTKWNVPVGEQYEHFYFAIPWKADDIATHYGSDLDNVPVLHQWMMFSYTGVQVPGTHLLEVYPTVAGSNSELIAGWAVGGNNVTYPADVGSRLPHAGEILVQWHTYNSTGAAAPDSSSAVVCVVPQAMRKNIASITWLGTEFLGFGPLGMPAGINNTSGTCLNNAGTDITIIGFWPHMHKTGRHMKSTVRRTGSTTDEVVFDRPFDFNQQTYYGQQAWGLPDVVLKAGDSITSTCTFNVPPPGGIPFGVSSTEEVCNQFAFSYPAGALVNVNPAIFNGATNTCW